jgi:hypothetical protein
MIFVRGVVINAIVFQGPRQAARQTLPARILSDEFTSGDHAHQIAGQFFRPLTLYA